MTIDLESIFRYQKPNAGKLLREGFVNSDTGYTKALTLMQGQFSMAVTVAPDGTVGFKVTEVATGEEYALVHVAEAQGQFVGAVRAACETVLGEIAQKCFDTNLFKAEQTQRVLEFIEEAYGVKPEFLWENTPDCAAFRCAENRKWFAALMQVDRSKIGIAGSGTVEIIDVKAPPATVEALLAQTGFLPAYHMNKKHWLTICLDGSLSDEAVFAALATSYDCIRPRVGADRTKSLPVQV